MDQEEKKTEEKPKEPKRKVWHPQQEKILKEWAEIGSSYRYLHDRSYGKFTSQHMWYSLPVILLSTITGTANFAQASMPSDAKAYAPLIIGSANLLAGMITTIAQFFRVSELMESHRVASISFGRFSRNIAVELSLPIQERSDSGTPFLNECRIEINKLLEQSPMIPLDIVKHFGKKFTHKMKCKKRIHQHQVASNEPSWCSRTFCCKKGSNVSSADDAMSDVSIDDSIECHCLKCTQFTKPEILEINPVTIYQPTKEEKYAEMTAMAAIKFKEKLDEKEKRMREQGEEDDFKKEPTALDIIQKLSNFSPFSLDSPVHKGPSQKPTKSKSVQEMASKYKDYNSEDFMARYEQVEEGNNTNSLVPEDSPPMIPSPVAEPEGSSSRNEPTGTIQDNNSSTNHPPSINPDGDGDDDGEGNGEEG